MGEPDSDSQNNFTADAMLGGKIKVEQEKDGYRFSIDAVLLSCFADTYKKSTILDLGAGCGIMPLILATLNSHAKIFGVEIQESLARLAQKNIEINNFGSRITIFHQDLKNLPIPEIPAKVDMVVSNPPYRKMGSGRVNPDSQKAVARHEIKANISDVASCAAKMLDKGGCFALIYPATRLAGLICELQKNNLEPKRLRMVHSNRNSPAMLALVEAVKGAGSQLIVEPVLYIYDRNGEYTSTVKKMLYPD